MLLILLGMLSGLRSQDHEQELLHLTHEKEYDSPVQDETVLTVIELSRLQQVLIEIEQSIILREMRLLVNLMWVAYDKQRVLLRKLKKH